MKTRAFAALTVVLSTVLATSALAQGRHDEKPHGMSQSAAAPECKVTRTATGGRHDEGVTTHGARRAAESKMSASADGNKGCR